jgi:hypothetical protein
MSASCFKGNAGEFQDRGGKVGASTSSRRPTDESSQRGVSQDANSTSLQKGNSDIRPLTNIN